MTWPWVSRVAYEGAVAERDRAIEDARHSRARFEAAIPKSHLEAVVAEVVFLRERNAQLTEQLVRVQRFQAGMAETPRAERGSDRADAR